MRGLDILQLVPKSALWEIKKLAAFLHEAWLHLPGGSFFPFASLATSEVSSGTLVLWVSYAVLIAFPAVAHAGPAPALFPPTVCVKSASRTSTQQVQNSEGSWVSEGENLLSRKRPTLDVDLSKK